MKKDEVSHSEPEMSLRRRIQDQVAVNAAKATAFTSHLAGKNGTSLPGKTALMASPRVLDDLAAQVRKGIFVVCGTNGKTTVNNLLCHMLETEGFQVVCNRLGANMLYGVTGAFTSAADHFGRLHADYACLEVDEASAPLVLPRIRPAYLILTNLFRDQLDRYGEIDTTIELLEKAIRQVPGMKLLVNADDPLSVYLAQKTGNPWVSYGVSESAEAAGYAGSSDTGDVSQGTEIRPLSPGVGGEIREGRFCKCCGAQLSYSVYHFGQMGIYRCPSCSFCRPEPCYQADQVISRPEGLTFRINGQALQTGLHGFYHVYNLLAVWGALCECGLDGSGFSRALTTYAPQFGRSETFRIGGCSVLLNLAKNPAGFNQNLDAMLEDPRPKDLIIAINDNDQDGTDVSWLWDVDFEKIGEKKVRSVTVSGIRALDMYLRLKYEEIGAQIVPDVRDAVDGYLAAGSENLYVLVNYTVLFQVHQYLQRKEDGK